MIITYDPERERPVPRKASVTLNGVYLRPGTNEVSQEDLEKLLAYDGIDLYIKYGAIEIPPEALPKQENILDSFVPTEVRKNRRAKSDTEDGTPRPE
jgi:hypothetical protein